LDKKIGPKCKDRFSMPHIWCNNVGFSKVNEVAAFFPGGIKAMWIEKLIDGILQLDTPVGPRYVQPRLWQRAYLIWMFRNFNSLPVKVLRPWESRLIGELRKENQYVSRLPVEAATRPVIGIIECAQTPANVVPIRKSASGVKSAVPDQGRKAASA
jgi:hypothetical protein